ncbi:hypothetical protein RJT34_15636 [Clitoria ternatea]|uniref:Uncharacterized protein n=1 Tax=Clitoria ternatea TaxID=43366 RepID=A0AAN9J7P5_CLITE
MRTASNEFAIWDCGSPLYDSFELVSLSHVIERHMMGSPYLGGSKQITTKFSNPDEMMMVSTRNTKCSSKLASLSDFLEKIIMWKTKVTQKGKEKKHNKTNIGFSMLVCGGNRVQLE